MQEMELVNTSQGVYGCPAAPAASIQCTSTAFAQLSSEILRAGKDVRFRASGGSMSPLVRDGDVLMVRPAGPTSIRFGDVVLVTDDRGCLLVHRVVGRSAGPDGICFTVQGDQVSRPDGVIPATRVYGRVTAIERGSVSIDMNQPSLRVLGWAAALRSRWNRCHARPYRLAAGLVKKLPAFSRYVA